MSDDKNTMLCPQGDYCENDIVVHWFRRVFGDEYINHIIKGEELTNSVQELATTNPIQFVISELGMVSLLMIGVILMIFIFKRIFKAAQTGTPFEEGEGLASITRPFYSFLMILPVKYGFPFIAHMFLWIALLSNGLANRLIDHLGSASFSMPAFFIAETDSRGNKVDNAVQSVSFLREANHLKEPMYVGAMHGYCVKHYINDHKFTVRVGVGGISQSPMFVSGKVKITFRDADKSWAGERWESFTNLLSPYKTKEVGMPDSTTSAEESAQERAMGTKNQLCGEFLLDFMTVSEVGEGTFDPSSNNADIKKVNDAAKPVLDHINVSSAVVHNSRAMYQARAYAVGFDAALGSEGLQNAEIRAVRDSLRKGLAMAVDSYAGQGVLDSRSRYGVALDAQSLSEFNKKSRQAIFNTEGYRDIKATSYDPYLSRYNYQPSNGWKMMATEQNGTTTISPANLESLWQVAENMERSMDKAHYIAMGGSARGSRIGSPSLTELDTRLENIQNEFKKTMASKGWLNMPNAFSLASNLQQEIGKRVLTDPSSSKIFAMAKVPDNLEENSKVAVDTLTAIYNEVGKQASEFDSEIVGTKMMMTSMATNQDSSDINPSIFNGAISPSIFLSTEKVMIDTLTGNAQNLDNDMLTRMQLVGQLAGVGKAGAEALQVGFTSAATVTAAAASGVALTAGWAGAIRVAFDTLLQNTLPAFEEIINFFDGVHTFFAVIIPNLPTMMLILAAVGFFIQVVVSMIAAIPFMVLHATPNQSFVGSNTALYLLALNLVFKAILIVGSFLLVKGMLNATLPVVIDVWFNTRSNMASNLGGGVAETIALLMSAKKSWYLLAGMLTSVTYLIAGLVQELPEQVSNIMNTNIFPALGQMNSERFIAGVSGAVAGGSAIAKQRHQGRMAGAQKSVDARQKAADDRQKELANQEKGGGRGGSGGGDAQGNINSGGASGSGGVSSGAAASSFRQAEMAGLSGRQPKSIAYRVKAAVFGETNTQRAAQLHKEAKQTQKIKSGFRAASQNWGKK